MQCRAGGSNMMSTTFMDTPWPYPLGSKECILKSCRKVSEQYMTCIFQSTKRFDCLRNEIPGKCCVTFEPIYPRQNPQPGVVGKSHILVVRTVWRDYFKLIFGTLLKHTSKGMTPSSAQNSINGLFSELSISELSFPLSNSTLIPFQSHRDGVSREEKLPHLEVYFCRIRKIHRTLAGGQFCLMGPNEMGHPRNAGV